MSITSCKGERACIGGATCELGGGLQPTINLCGPTFEGWSQDADILVHEVDGSFLRLFEAFGPCILSHKGHLMRDMGERHTSNMKVFRHSSNGMRMWDTGLYLFCRVCCCGLKELRITGLCLCLDTGCDTWKSNRYYFGGAKTFMETVLVMLQNAQHSYCLRHLIQNLYGKTMDNSPVKYI